LSQKPIQAASGGASLLVTSGGAARAGPMRQVSAKSADHARRIIKAPF
jgi:hypothetical protein